MSIMYRVSWFIVLVLIALPLLALDDVYYWPRSNNTYEYSTETVVEKNSTSNPHGSVKSSTTSAAPVERVTIQGNHMQYPDTVKMIIYK